MTEHIEIREQEEGVQARENLSQKRRRRKMRKNDWELQTMVWLGVLFVAVFCYAPLFGIILAFKDGNNVLNIMNAILYGDWVGWENFRSFLADGEFIDVMLNTLGLNGLMMLINFPAPVLFALVLFALSLFACRSVVPVLLLGGGCLLTPLILVLCNVAAKRQTAANSRKVKDGTRAESER